jgi:hypothetical protein
LTYSTADQGHDREKNKGQAEDERHAGALQVVVAEALLLLPGFAEQPAGIPERAHREPGEGGDEDFPDVETAEVHN